MTRLYWSGNILHNRYWLNLDHVSDVLEQFGQCIDKLGLGGGKDFNYNFAELELHLLKGVF
jgi:hypothetical protein